MTDRCVQVFSEREQDMVDCRNHLVEENVLPESATFLDGTRHYENTLDGACDFCPVYENCPVCAKYE